MRAFIGCPLTKSDRDVLCAWMHAHLGAGWRPIRAQNLHLTLYFLGEQTAPALAALAASLHALGPLPEARGRGTRVRPFPGPAAPLLALELIPDRGLLALHARVTDAVTSVEPSTESRRFRPHITLARGNGAYGSQALAAEFTFTRLCLFASQPGPQGVTYRALNCRPLGDAAARST